METPTVHMHTLKVGILDTSSVDGGYSFERFTTELGKRLHLLVPFRRRLVPVPGNLHHPMWLEDPNFDLRNHVHRTQVAAPGGRAELDEVVGRIAGIPLDRSRPLWELWVVEGLEHGQIATVGKIHHMVADGVAAAAMLAAVMGTDPEMSDPPPPSEPWRPERIPTRPELLAGALRDLWTQLRALPQLVAATARSLGALRRARRGFELPVPRPFLDAPDTSFNVALSADRLYATASLPLKSFREIRRAFDVDFNDVVLAVTSGALRRWFALHGGLPAKSVLASVPVSAASDTRLYGNRLSSLLTSLCTDIEDPVERLLRIHKLARQAKVVQDTLGKDMLEAWVQYTPPGPFAAAMRLYSRLRLADRHPPPVNLIVSNVPGPRETLYAAGAKLTGLYSVGPLMEGMGLNVTVWSYAGQMNFAALSCRRAMDDLPRLVEGLSGALAELLGAAGDLEPRPDAARSAG